MSTVKAHCAHEGQTPKHKIIFLHHRITAVSREDSLLGHMECFIHVDSSVFAAIATNFSVNQLSVISDRK